MWQRETGDIFEHVFMHVHISLEHFVLLASTRIRAGQTITLTLCHLLLHYWERKLTSWLLWEAPSSDSRTDNRVDVGEKKTWRKEQNIYALWWLTPLSLWKQNKERGETVNRRGKTKKKSKWDDGENGKADNPVISVGNFDGFCLCCDP